MKKNVSSGLSNIYPPTEIEKEGGSVMSLARFKTNRAIKNCKFHLCLFSRPDTEQEKKRIIEELAELQKTLATLSGDKDQYVKLKAYCQESGTDMVLKDIPVVKETFKAFSNNLTILGDELIALEIRYEKKILFQEEDFQKHFADQFRMLQKAKAQLSTFFTLENLLYFEEQEVQKVKEIKVKRIDIALVTATEPTHKSVRPSGSNSE